ncbi:hypothetical protein [uncultured Gammaproteobacteria bacterium]|nr:hypothetical protein [uncultured Gammaproteobacteria bacterium]
MNVSRADMFSEFLSHLCGGESRYFEIIQNLFFLSHLCGGESGLRVLSKS